jgi:hypothetical protein
LDFGDTLTEFNASLSDAQADKLAIRADWRAVGADLAHVARNDVAEQLELLTTSAWTPER